MWDFKPKKITSATLGLEAKIAPTIIFHIGLLTSLYYLVVLEHPHQYVQNFFHFAHLKPTFSILHAYFYKTPPSVCLLYTFIQIKYSFF